MADTHTTVVNHDPRYETHPNDVALMRALLIEFLLGQWDIRDGHVEPLDIPARGPGARLLVENTGHIGYQRMSSAVVFGEFTHDNRLRPPTPMRSLLTWFAYDPGGSLRAYVYRSDGQHPRDAVRLLVEILGLDTEPYPIMPYQQATTRVQWPVVVSCLGLLAWRAHWKATHP